MNDPKIAIAVVVENSGFGSTWAAPIASLIMEKYLTDSLRADRVKEVERISGTNLMPDWIPREQYKADSVRAYQWFKWTNDSSYIKKYLRRGARTQTMDTTKRKLVKPVTPVKQQQRQENDTTPQQRIGKIQKLEMIEPKNNWKHKRGTSV